MSCMLLFLVWGVVGGWVWLSCGNPGFCGIEILWVLAAVSDTLQQYQGTNGSVPLVLAPSVPATPLQCNVLELLVGISVCCCDLPGFNCIFSLQHSSASKCSPVYWAMCGSHSLSPSFWVLWFGKCTYMRCCTCFSTGVNCVWYIYCPLLMKLFFCFLVFWLTRILEGFCLFF